MATRFVPGAVSALLFALAASTACGSDDGGDVAGGGNTGVGSAGGTGASGGSGATTGSGGGLNVGGSSSGGGAGDGGVVTGNEDKCDGIDNDKNGIIDDVDVGKDGICDCLRIGTLGEPGTVGQPNVFDAWLAARSTYGTTPLKDKTITAAVLAEFQVIVSQNVSVNHAYSAAEVSALATWVKAGGGFMTLIGYAGPSEIQNVNQLLAPFGMSYGPEQILQKSGANTIPVTNWVKHPVTNGVSQIGVDNGYPVNGAGLALASEQSWTVLRAQEVTSGKVLMWGDEWLTFDSEWKGHPEYQVELFWLNALKWLTPANNCQVPIPPSIK
ncbi:MAG: hypothetical protein IT377_26435 [Polyangiaceae bacterium]|nr:hypothetical protein [Polyangiaceae bacterium]